MPGKKVLNIPGDSKIDKKEVVGLHSFTNSDQTRNIVDYASGAYDETMGKLFDENQRTLLKSHGLDEYDMIFVDGKSVREHFKFNGGMYPDKEDAKPYMKHFVTKSLMNSDAKVEFTQIREKEVNGIKGFSVEEPTTVEADSRISLKPPAKPPKPPSMFQSFLNLFRQSSIRKEQEAQKLKETNEMSKRHDEIKRSVSAQSIDVKSIQRIHEPFIKAREEFNKINEHNAKCFDSVKNSEGKALSGAELSSFYMNSAFGGNKFRPASRYGIINGYMLGKGLTIDELCNTDSLEMDEKKKAISQEFFTLNEKAAKAGEKANKEAEERAGKEFDANLPSHRAKIEEELKNENIKAAERNKDFTMPEKDFNKSVGDRLEWARDAAIRNEKEKAILDLSKNDPDVIKLREAYMDIGKAFMEQKIPVTKKLTDPEEMAKNYSKMNILRFAGLDYGHNFTKPLRESLSSDDKNLFEKYNDTASVICNIGLVQNHSVDFMANPVCTDKVHWGGENLLRGVVAWNVLEQADGEIKGKEKFSDLKYEKDELEFRYSSALLEARTSEKYDGTEFKDVNNMTRGMTANMKIGENLTPEQIHSEDTQRQRKRSSTIIVRPVNENNMENTGMGYKIVGIKTTK